MPYHSLWRDSVVHPYIFFYKNFSEVVYFAAPFAASGFVIDDLEAVSVFDIEFMFGLMECALADFLVFFEEFFCYVFQGREVIAAVGKHFDSFSASSCPKYKFENAYIACIFLRTSAFCYSKEVLNGFCVRSFPFVYTDAFSDVFASEETIKVPGVFFSRTSCFGLD